MSRNSGRFETTTKVKVSTPNGNVLMVNHYPVDEEPFVDYRIRPKCSICGGNAPCMCFGYDNFDDPLEEATESLLKEFVCENPHCICKIYKKIKPEEYKKLKKKYGDDVWSICEKIAKRYFTEDDDGLFCEV